MWGVNGEYSFLAEEAGATRVFGVDVVRADAGVRREAAHSQFERRVRPGRHLPRSTRSRASGQVDVVFCAGVLYHHPSPFDLLVALRRICRQTLILRTSTIPEVKGLPNAAVYFPMMDAKGRELWSLKSAGRPSPGRHQQRVPGQRRLRQLVLGADAELPRITTRRPPASASTIARPRRSRRPSSARPSTRRSITACRTRTRRARWRRKSRPPESRARPDPCNPCG